MRLTTPPTDPQHEDTAAGASGAPADDGDAKDQTDRRSNDRKHHRMMVAMAPLDTASGWRTSDLNFTMVRCVDHSEGGLGVVLPEKPTFTEACFFLVRRNRPMHVVARLRSVAEAVYERRPQFRAGFELIGVVAADGSIEPMSGESST
jgi:hypothetical protein